MSKQLGNRLKALSRNKGEKIQEQNASNKITNNILVNKWSSPKKLSLISKKIEEKQIHSAKGKSIEKNSSINKITKKKCQQLIDQQYGVRAFKKQPILTSEQLSFELLCNSRDSARKVDEKLNIFPRMKLLRARSNDSFSKIQTHWIKQIQSKKKVRLLKEQNIFLKQKYTKSLKQIEEYSSQLTKQQEYFKGQKKGYERQIDYLRGKVDRNRVDIGHLFSFRSFNPITMVVNPIIEVEQANSMVRSLCTSSKHFQEKEKAKIDSQDGLVGKENKTETTCVNQDDKEFF